MCTAWLAGCSKKVADPVTRSSFLLNTFVTVTLYDTEDQTILDGCMTLCSDYEKLLSKTLEGSEIYKLNHRRPDRHRIGENSPGTGGGAGVLPHVPGGL